MVRHDHVQLSRLVQGLRQSYSGSSEPTTSGFAPAPSPAAGGDHYTIGRIKSYTNTNIQYAGTNGADIMIAQSPSANPTSYAYYPGCVVVAWCPEKSPAD